MLAMDPTDLAAVRHRLLAVLRARLSEAEDDEARQAAWEATNWDLAAGDTCPRCNKPALRFKDGVCFPCVAALTKRADRLVKLVQASKKHGLWFFPKKKVRLVQ